MSSTTLELQKQLLEHIEDPRYRPYEPFGSAIELLYGKEDEILLCGPAGTGKSRVCLEKLHLCACKYKGMRGLMVRKTRESLTQSAMVTFENMVVPPNGTVKFRTAEQEYRYVNGSVIALGGMDKASKILSSEYDLIYVMQGEELLEDDYETLTTRNRYGVMPYNQILMDVNPNHPRHWAKLRADRGDMRYIYSRHEDNPILFDHTTDAWTEFGKSYIARLSKLTGVRRKRLYEGIWAAAEGMIYIDEWNEEIHRIPRRAIPQSWLRIWVVDFGFTNPFVWQCWALDEDNRAYRIAEIYRTQLLVEDACAMIRSWKKSNNEPDPVSVVCDHDAEGRATLERHLEVLTIPANKKVLEGIEATKSKLRIQDDGKPGLFFLRDSVKEIDYNLREIGKPTCTEEEFDGYEWSDNTKKEQPRKEDDHGLDATRYLCMHLEEQFGTWSIGMGS